MELYFYGVGKGVPLHVLLAQSMEKSRLWAALPHRLCFLQEAQPTLEGVWLQLAQSQLCWEMFGMLTQYRLTAPNPTEKAALKTHLIALSQFHERCVVGRSDRGERAELAELDATLRKVAGHLS